MIHKKKSTTFRLIIISLLLIPLINQYLIFIAYANANYTSRLEKGTQILEVKKYDDQTWKNTVNVTSTPRDWFGGNSDKIGAKSKTTLLEMGHRDFMTSSIFHTLIFTNKTSSIFTIVRNYGYGEEYINENYTYYYFAWEYSFHYWTFTSSEFKIQPDFFYDHSIILQNPQNISQILDNYNEFASTINNNATLQSLNISFPLLSGDYLVWQFIIKRFAIGNPINDYLTTFTNILDCKNTTIQGKTLIFQRRGIKNYTVEVFYNPQGIIETFKVKNSEGYVFYEITSFYPKIVFYIILGILAVFVMGIVVLFIIKKKKLQKYYTQN